MRIIVRRGQYAGPLLWETNVEALAKKGYLFLDETYPHQATFDTTKQSELFQIRSVRQCGYIGLSSCCLRSYIGSCRQELRLHRLFW